MARLQFPTNALFLYCTLIITMSGQFHFIHAKPRGLSLKIIPRDCPESPLYAENLTLLSYQPLEIRLRMLAEEIFFVVQVGIGTPEKHMFLVVDTGAGLIWTQCEPCINCYPQAYPIYDSTASISYRKLPCSHPLCQGDSALYQCLNGECVYHYGYGSGEATKGIASLDTFEILVGDQTTTEFIPDVIFGCSKESNFPQFAKNGVISGILGLNLSPDSLVNQLFDDEDRRFSHCFLPFPDAMISPSFLKFGNDIPPPPANIQTTPFVTPPGKYHYNLNLLDISVGTHRIGFHPDTFKIQQDGSGGFIIDSGTLFTHIDENTLGIDAFYVVMTAFQYYYDSFSQLQRIGPPLEGFALCYLYQPDFEEFATMTYHFEGGDYFVDSKYVNYYAEEGYFCVAMTEGNGNSVLGAWHQQNMRITYDVNGGALHFASEICE
ncbi:aspartic proteinase nepenthesin-2-like [Juglans regia]|uniref:Aspartic proteinase nepenthesin-2-like n=2 Tax=Juglans regia TaxID=51240 RepID=A0A2I4DST1_JUGRE|nr:aspartic proteinase nepenthesin-2-like [Juglans regia]